MHKSRSKALMRNVTVRAFPTLRESMNDRFLDSVGFRLHSACPQKNANRCCAEIQFPPVRDRWQSLQSLSKPAFGWARSNRLAAIVKSNRVARARTRQTYKFGKTGSRLTHQHQEQLKRQSFMLSQIHKSLVAKCRQTLNLPHLLF